MSPFVSATLSVLSNGDLAGRSADILQLRKDVLVADVIASHEEHDGAQASEITTQFVAALQAGDRQAEYDLWTQARDYDRAQPFGARLVEELDALADRFSSAAA